MRVGSICTGYGGIELGLDVRPAWVAEIDPHASALLARVHPTVPNLGDITAVDWTRVEYVDLLVGGIPCQPVSAAGRQRGTDDARWLWPYALDAIKALQPERFLLENVRNLVSIQGGALFRGICDDLNRAGYDVRWLTLGACHVGLAHHRHRVFLLAARVDSWRREPTCERVTTSPCGLSAKALPTPLARDGDARRNGAEGTREYWAAREIDRAPLGAIGALLPTPTASSYGTNQGGAAGRTGPVRPSLQTLGGRPDLWGPYAEAIARHAARYGDPPAPTEPNGTATPRLSPAFAEWLMAIPAGHVTSNTPDRNTALRLIGNGVSPPQIALAWRLLTQPTEGSTTMSKKDPTAPAAEPDAVDPGPTDPITPGRGVETALGGVSREQVQADSPIFAEIMGTLAFHGVELGPQILREVFGAIARLAMPDGVVRRPANRPAELREWPAASIRQLAALCRVYSPGDDVTVAPLPRDGIVEPALSAPDPLRSHEEQREAAAPEPVELVEPTAEQLARGDAAAAAVAAMMERQPFTVDEQSMLSPNGHGPVFHAPEPYEPARDAPPPLAPVFHAPEAWREDMPPTPMSTPDDGIPF